MRRRKPEADIQPRHICRAGVWFLLRRYGPPILLVLLVIDLALWGFFHFVLERCYGIGCLMGE